MIVVEGKKKSHIYCLGSQEVAFNTSKFTSCSARESFEEIIKRHLLDDRFVHKAQMELLLQSQMVEMAQMMGVEIAMEMMQKLAVEMA